MIAGFRTAWPKKMEALAGEPTHFVEKIWKGIPEQPITGEFAEAIHSDRFQMDAYKEVIGKPHTIREDPGKRWKVGMDIHFYINVRRKDMFQFAPVKQVTEIQEIEIKHGDSYASVYIDGSLFGDVFHYGLDDIYDYHNCVEELALNDGFPSVEAFFSWFNKDFTGRIIHWTDIRY